MFGRADALARSHINFVPSAPIRERSGHTADLEQSGLRSGSPGGLFATMLPHHAAARSRTLGREVL